VDVLPTGTTAEALEMPIQALLVQMVNWREVKGTCRGKSG
jgi:hypothetical protein